MSTPELGPWPPSPDGEQEHDALVRQICARANVPPAAAGAAMVIYGMYAAGDQDQGELVIGHIIENGHEDETLKAFDALCEIIREANRYNRHTAN